ncbi:WD40 repeat-like protein [Terfezia boudieri ATCC MYA-4762]|uniref:WD40 repeat-like protein n=1 Tax=Terfezia boudieri ATCC MYA-4762 TaxID=1051890 RepID=A0A3N4LVC3_9PEZI|nr:WD40 repeat-like protein [Terfezia boudieri ATCC MYA-4762]
MKKLRFNKRTTPNSSSRSRSSITSRLSFLKLSTSSSKSGDFGTAEEIHGPLGLNLLYSPPEPQIELVFVHGLGGGSRKTWCKDGDAANYWPKEWLPMHPEFRNVRIHSFGYDSSYLNMNKSLLSVHDFGLSLLTELRSSPLIGRGENAHNPLVFVAHSMGGIVTKKAYLLARQDPECQPLAQRFRAMVFLATPHRGSDYASLLNNILSVTLGARRFIKNIERGSEALEEMNDQFRQVASHLKLCSLYETQKMGFSAVVPKDSAILGYPEEQVAVLTGATNHRDICKFNQQSDPNFITVSNIIGAVLETLVKTVSQRQIEESGQQIRRLGDYLGSLNKPEDDLTSLEEKRQPRSCEWIAENEQFRRWHSLTSHELSIFWINANPGTGKSVLSAYIINYLEKLDQDCFYYFFRTGDKMKSVLPDFLLSMAFQMAEVCKSVRRNLLKLMEQDVRFDKDNAQIIWKKLFTLSIFRAEFHRPFFWVIDALDECEGSISFFNMISKLELNIPIRILITSRRTREIETHALRVQKQFSEKYFIDAEILASDTRHDMSLYLRTQMDSLPVSSEENRRRLVDKILEQAAGSFLWVELVMKEFEGAFSEEQIERVLEDMPGEMEPFYQRALRLMASKSAESRSYAKAILTWAMCSTRPLTIPELQTALILDIGQTIDCIERAIVALCGQMVYVDKHQRVQMVHETARAFLLRTDLDSEFAVNPVEGHKRLAKVCLTYLNSDDMKGAGIQRVGRGPPRKTSPLLNYACTSFSEHIRQAHPRDDMTVQQLDSFFRTNILSWIEYIAGSGNLYQMTHAAQVLSHYQELLAAQEVPMAPEVERIKVWAAELSRLVAKFGKPILECPKSIYRLVPPFCPETSVTATQFGSAARGLKVVGISNSTWSDQLSCIEYRDEKTSTVACGESYFAVGLSSGDVKLYDNSTCQERRTMQHGEWVESLEFSASGQLLLSCGMSNIILWNIENGSAAWKQRVDDKLGIMSLTFAFDDAILMGATSRHTVCSWDVTDGSFVEDVGWGITFGEESSRRPPKKAAFSPDWGFLAVIYRGRPISLWDLEARCFAGYLGREENPAAQGLGTNTSAENLVFSSDPSICRLAVAYEDGDLAFFDAENQTLLQCTSEAAQILASSPDGRTLASGNWDGMIQLFDFVSMKLLYQINGFEYSVKALAFSSDNMRLLDARPSQLNIWEPAVLLRKNGKQSTSAPTVVGVNDLDEGFEITAVECHSSGDSIFCGRSDGSVVVHEAQTGKQVGILCPANHSITVKCLAWGDASSILVTVDTAGDFRVLSVRRDPWEVSETLLKGNSAESVNQILLSPNNKFLLISTASSNTVWRISGKSVLSSHGWPETYEHSSFLWLNHHSNPSQRILLTLTKAYMYQWPTSVQEQTIHLDDPRSLTNHTIRTALICPSTGSIAVEICKRTYPDLFTGLSLFESTMFTGENPTLSPKEVFTKLDGHILHLIGFHGTKLVFLDYKLWVCTVDVNDFDGNSYAKHFFIPQDWQNAVRQLVMGVTASGDVVFVKKDEVAFIKRGLFHNSHIAALRDDVEVTQSHRVDVMPV